MFDSHIHLDFETLAPDRLKLLKKAGQQGISAFFVPGCCTDQWDRLSALKEEASMAGAEVHVGVGQHPYFYNEAPDVEVLCASIFDRCRALGAVALGEFGVDKGRGGCIERQGQLFEAQLRLADELDLPVVLHQVGLQAEFLSSLKRAGTPRAGGVVHGFVGGTDWGRALIVRGFHLGIGVAITDEKRSKLATAVAELPLERLLIETDAPDQSPSGQKGAGVPEDLLLVRERIAEIRGVKPQEIGERSEKSARALFRVQKPSEA